MQHLGLSQENGELLAYHQALSASHTIRVRVAICDLDENPIATIVPRILTGQVTVDTTRDVTRMLSLQLLDPRNQLDLDPNSRSDGSVFLDRIVKIYYGVWVESLARWVTCQVFTGVPWQLDRDGALVTIEAHGKERLSLRPTWRPFSRAAGQKKVDVLRAFLAARSGEARFDFPAIPAKLPHPFTVTREQIMWERAKQLARSMDRQLFYDGRGVCRLRSIPGSPVVTFRRGPGGQLVEEVNISTSVGDFANTAHVQGRKGLEPGVASLRPSHPLSAAHLTRGGVPGVIAVFDHNDHIRKTSEVDARAVRLLDRQDQATVGRTYSVLPYPHLDELDLVGVELEDGSVERDRLTSWALSLTTESQSAMPVGHTRRLTAARGQIRKR